MMRKYPPIKIKDGKKYFFRFTLDQRIQHIILAITVIILVLTGMPLKFSNESWAPYLNSLFGGIHMAPIVHKITGAIMLILFVYHVISITTLIMKNHILPLKKEGKLKIGQVIKTLLTQPMVPNMKDARDIWGLMKYLLYFTNIRPDGDEYTWKEKFDYWAPFWGMVIIGLSGLVLWNKVLATQILPGEVLNFCLIAHSDEALLAALFLFIWHWYNVHFSTSVFPMGTVFLTGYLSEELMVEEHYHYYVKVMKEAGLEHEILPPHGGHSTVASHESITEDPDSLLAAAAVRQEIPSSKED
ncbi:MAG: formate dehydrogenase subunit gamma [Desulforhopalus sp.]|jgi:formate dehydrogenase subunit gamma